MKVCTKCKIKKQNTTEHYHKNQSCRDGLSTICKECRNRATRERYAKGTYVRVYKKRGKDPNQIKIKPMKKSFPYTASPKNALSKHEIEKISYKVGQLYKATIKEDRNITRFFRGTLIQETKDHITLQNKRGTRESFMKVDFMINDKIKEVN